MITGKKITALLVLLIFFPVVYFVPLTCNAGAATGVVSDFSYRLVRTYPHDPEAFTQGLVIDNGVLFEGTGLNGKSSLRKVEIETGKILRIKKLPQKFFGEGITTFGNRIIQLTWKSGVGLVFDKDNFDLLQQFTYPYEGWGITNDGQYLIMSDGSAHLYFFDPVRFEEKKRMTVTEGDKAVTMLNELEYVNGKIFANIWKSDLVAIIDPEGGRVIGWIDLSGLSDMSGKLGSEKVLNGIAFDEGRNALFVTGKLWPYLFQIEIIPKEEKQ